MSSRNDGIVAGGRVFDDEARVPVEWEAGDRILGRFVVTRVLGAGAMGRVYGTSRGLVIKRPNLECAQSFERMVGFFDEAETWMRLGLHENVVACFGAEMINDVPIAWIEEVEGGSLESWISSGHLHRGDPTESTARVLDIAIQIARGLAHVHECQLVHEDVKPDNVLLTQYADAKVTDFGLTRSAWRHHGVAASDSATFAGGTPLYMSPEQAHAYLLARRGAAADDLSRITGASDVWSWALTVLHMLVGEPMWHRGWEADEWLHGELARGTSPLLVAVPRALVELLDSCLQVDPTLRPDFESIASDLSALYESVTGTECRRSSTVPLALLADVLNNHAISLFAFGRRDRATEVLDRALRLCPEYPAVRRNYARLGLRQRAYSREDVQAIYGLDADALGVELESCPLRGHGTSGRCFFAGARGWRPRGFAIRDPHWSESASFELHVDLVQHVRGVRLSDGLGVDLWIPSGGYSRDENDKQFRRLLALLPGLQHPAIARLVALEISDSVPWYATAATNFGTMRDRIEGFEDAHPDSVPPFGPVDPNAALRVLAGPLDALGHLHRRGFVHANVIPSAIALETVGGRLDGRLTGLRFLARCEEARPRSMHISPGFFAPEHLDPDQPFTPRTDVFGVAAVLYYALTGEPPRRRDGRDPWLAEIIPIDVRAPQLPPSIRAAITSGLADDPELRPRDAIVFRDLLFDAR